MAIFSVEIADEDVGRVVDAICENYAWKAKVSDPHDPMNIVDNPETKFAFANRMVRNFLKEHVKKYEIDRITKEVTAALEADPVISDPQA